MFYSKLMCDARVDQDLEANKRFFDGFGYTPKLDYYERVPEEGEYDPRFFNYICDELKIQKSALIETVESIHLQIKQIKIGTNDLVYNNQQAHQFALQLGEHIVELRKIDDIFEYLVDSDPRYSALRKTSKYTSLTSDLHELRNCLGSISIRCIDLYAVKCEHNPNYFADNDLCNFFWEKILELKRLGEKGVNTFERKSYQVSNLVKTLGDYIVAQLKDLNNNPSIGTLCTELLDLNIITGGDKEDLAKYSVSVDILHLYIILDNLIRNTFRPSVGAENFTTTIYADISKSRLIIALQDDGVGIEKRHFPPGSTDNSSVGGTGHGLPSVFMRILKNGARLDCISCKSGVIPHKKIEEEIVGEVIGTNAELPEPPHLDGIILKRGTIFYITLPIYINDEEQ